MRKILFTVLLACSALAHADDASSDERGAAQASYEDFQANYNSLLFSLNAHIAAMESELRKLGATVTSGPDSVTIRGRQALRGARVHSHNDHRVVMALSARTRRAVMPKVGIELDVFAPGGKRAVLVTLPGSED